MVRVANGLDQDEFGKFIGKGRSTVAAYENGFRVVPPEVIAETRSAFHGTPAPPTGLEVEITGPALSDGLLAKIRYAGIVPCSSAWGDPLASDETRSIEPKFAGPKRFICKVSGDSCYPALQQGDVTIWESDQNPPYGVIVLAELDADSSCTVKVLERGEEPNRPRLTPINPAYDSPPNREGWHVSARLVGVIRTSDGPEQTWFFEPGLKKDHLLLQIM